MLFAQGKFYIHLLVMRNFSDHFEACVSPDSSVGIATPYALDGPGIESRWEQDIPYPSRRALGPTQPPIKWVPIVFPVAKATGAWR